MKTIPCFDISLTHHAVLLTAMGKQDQLARERRQQPQNLEQALEDIEKRRHKKNPFGEQYVQLCLSGLQPQVGGMDAPAFSCTCTTWPAAHESRVRCPSTRQRQTFAAGRPQDESVAQANAVKGRAAVETAVTNVHVRVEVRNAMALLWQTAAQLPRLH